ncbi:MAG: restriction endonuclease [Desulfobacula sp.]|jgi:restriction endonuclease Mrr
MAQRKNKKAEFVLWMGPLLDALRELGDSGSPREDSDLIATNLKISDEKKEELMESGTPKGKDDGIDGFGTLQLNPFVSFKVIFQCKRYQGTVSRAKVGDLRNAMIGRADKGIMITTGNFSEDAKREAVRDGAPPIELIDAEMLIDMMEKEEIGLKPKTIFDVDYAFFDQYM